MNKANNVISFLKNIHVDSVQFVPSDCDPSVSMLTFLFLMLTIMSSYFDII